MGSSLQNPERPGQLDKEIFLKVEETRPGVGRRRLRGKAVRRTIPFQRKAIKKRSIATRVQDPWNQLNDSGKMMKNP